MKSNFPIFSFSHWGLTQSTNKRVKRIACFYSTNLRTYILYILFVSIFTIKYILPFPIHANNIYLLVSKICEPPDSFLSPRRLAEFQERFLRCGIRTARTVFCLIGTWQSRRSTMPSSLPSTCSYISFVLFRQAIPLPKKATGEVRDLCYGVKRGAVRGSGTSQNPQTPTPNQTPTKNN
jgi:hypothetical protein